jgi:TrmH family RNA methyltransferase
MVVLVSGGNRIMNNWKDNVYFVLVEPKEPGNVGASARAIKNMGFRNLCVVNPPAGITAEGRWFARNAHDVLDSAAAYSSVAEAIRDRSIVAGTTRRRGKKRGVIMPAREGAEKLFRLAGANKVAILFGREARGLFNEEVEECGFMLSIPSSKMQPSLNLSHAVLIVAYELFLAEYGGRGAADEGGPYLVPPGPGAPPHLKGHGEIADLYEKIAEALELLEYIKRGDRNLKNKIMLNLKHFIGRAGLTEWELKMLYGLCHQVRKTVNRR